MVLGFFVGVLGFFVGPGVSVGVGVGVGGAPFCFMVMVADLFVFESVTLITTEREVVLLFELILAVIVEPLKTTPTQSFWFEGDQV